MVKVFAVVKPLVRFLMKFYGITPQIVGIEPGTVIKIWVPTETLKNKSKPKKVKPAVVFLQGFAADGIFTWLSQVIAFSGKYSVFVSDLLFFGGSTTDKPDRF